jgi:hypothetical protein
LPCRPSADRFDMSAIGRPCQALHGTGSAPFRNDAEPVTI